MSERDPVNGLVPRAADPSDQNAIMALVEAAASHDGVGPLSEHSLLHLRYGGDGPETGTRTKAQAQAEAEAQAEAQAEAEAEARTEADDGADHGSHWAALLSDPATGAALGYAHLDRPAPGAASDAAASGELLVHPDHRGHGYGRTLLDAALDAARGPLRVWAHGDLPAARRLAAAAGLRRVRSLWKMHRPLTTPIPEVPAVADGVRIRTFEPGRDEAGWVEVNRAAFAGHPEQGSWTRDDLLVREQEPWFDPAGFFVAERDGRLVGFHWTKVHPDGTGEVYVVGVSPAAQGMGLGRVLTLTGLRHLRKAGLGDVMLYVDEDKPARRLYESLGFALSSVDVMYES